VAGSVTLSRLKNADAEPGQWLALGRNFEGQRFSPLAKINAENVAELGFAWEYEAKSRRGRVEHGQESTPIMVDGVLYASGPWGSAFAVDARTGKEVWRFDPDVDGSYNRRACCDVVNRGLAVWDGRVYVGTLDGHLVALDAETGKKLWKVDTLEDRDSRFYTITSPPQIASNVVVIGNSGGEFGVRGYITAYDRVSGEQRWRFYIVPRDPAEGPPENAAMELALETWGPNTDWSSGLGGTVWGEMNYDPDLNLLYVGTGNSTPYSGWHRDPSGKDNLFLVSILAIDPDDGSLAWHFQQVPWEIWDYTATANMILADLEIEGEQRKVIMQAPKNGFYYVLDRTNGEFISASPFAYVNWAVGLDDNGRPQVNPKAIYKEEASLVFPTFAGAHNWHPMAYNPQTGLTYIPVREEGMVISNEDEYQWTEGSMNVGSGSVFGPDLIEATTQAKRDTYAATVATHADEPDASLRGYLTAWDPITQSARWRVLISEGPYNGAGVLTTAGQLVVQGTATGHLAVYHAETGVKLQEIELGTGVMAAPISYELDGEQYIAVFAGGTAWMNSAAARNRYENYGRVLAFKLGGGDTPLPPVRVPQQTPAPPEDVELAPEVVEQGEELFHAHCFRCHYGRGEELLSAYPDLRRMTAETHAVYDNIVLGGALSSAGMASFADLISPEEADAIHTFLISDQKALYEQENAAN
jgi:quinohemoprotein ethanol dehydrogenase